MFEVPTGTSGCGALDYTKLKASGVERTPAQIEAALGRADAFNAGLYERALMLKESSITWTVPLRMLCPYFALSFLLPQKRLVELCFKKNEASKYIIKEADDNAEYDLEITELYLDLGLVTLEANVRYNV